MLRTVTVLVLATVLISSFHIVILRLASLLPAMVPLIAAPAKCQAYVVAKLRYDSTATSVSSAARAASNALPFESRASVQSLRDDDDTLTCLIMSSVILIAIIPEATGSRRS